MALPVPVVWSEECLRHGADPGDGGTTRGWPYGDVPHRANVIREAVVAAGATLVVASPHPDDAVLAVHDEGLVDYLRCAYETALAAPRTVPTLDRGDGGDTVAPHIFPTTAMLGAVPAGRPGTVRALAGRFCYDTATVVGEGTWEAARASVDAALTAVDLLLRGEPLAYALTRPPGHHASRSGYGGGSYLNAAACAAQAMRRAGARRVAVVDVDALHGNGTQAVFWDTAEVLVASVHLDPAAGCFPHYTGHADETGGERGGGATLNLPLPPGTDDDGWLAAVTTAVAAVRDQEPDAVVVSLGVGAAVEDVHTPLAVGRDAFREAGRRVAALGVPVAAVQEGGSHLATLGDYVVAALEGLADRP